MRTILCSFIASAGILVAGSVSAASGDGVINAAQGLIGNPALTHPLPVSSIALGSGFISSPYAAASTRSGAGSAAHREAEAGTHVADVLPLAPAEEKESSSMLLAGLAVIVALVAKRISG